MGFLGALTGSDVGKATMAAAGQNKTLINGLLANGHTIINTGEQKSGAALDNAIGAYAPWVGTGTDANALYADAIGLNGSAGNARATGAFQAGPGYDFALDQGTKAALRGASAGGLLASGNTLDALTQLGQGYANQEYGSWLDRLKGTSDTGLSAAGGQAQGYGAKADLYQGTADNQLGLESGVVQGLMGVNNQIAQAKEQQTAAKGGFLGGLLKGGISLGTKALSGGLF